MYLSPGLGCGGGCKSRGVGGLTFDGSGLFGSGLFASGLDLSQWTWAEMVAAALGGFVLYSVFSTTSRGARVVRKKVRYVAGAGKRRAESKAAALEAEARKLRGSF